MATPQNSFLDNVISDQAARQAGSTDQWPWMTRYLFVPFRDRGLTILQQQLYGLQEIKAAYVLPLTRLEQQVIDYDELKRVPTNYDGSYQPSDEGVSTMKLNGRRPMHILRALFDIFNPHQGTGNPDDNGICEIEALRGKDDMDLLRMVNYSLLPTHSHDTAKSQLMELRTALKRTDLPELVRGIGEKLVAATEQSVKWGEWHYQRLRAQMKNQARSGKEELSPLDKAVCRWIGQPEPELRGQLADEAQPVVVQGAAPAAVPQTQCLNCGTWVNLIAGNPPKICYICTATFPQGEAEVSAEPKCGDHGGITGTGAPCKYAAGNRTDHPGVGRCSVHEE